MNLVPAMGQSVASKRPAALATFLVLPFGWTSGLWAILAFPVWTSGVGTTIMLAERSQDDLAPLLTAAKPPDTPGFSAEVIAMGPIDKPSAMPEMLAALLYAAQREVILTTPYFVPVDALQSALRAAANRGVAVALILPARNDDLAVAAASRSYYGDLIGAGELLYK